MVEKVSASTQNQAFSALLLLFREVLRGDLEEMGKAEGSMCEAGPETPNSLVGQRGGDAVGRSPDFAPLEVRSSCDQRSFEVH